MNFRKLVNGQVDHVFRCVIGRKQLALFNHLANHAVQRFNRIGGVNGLTISKALAQLRRVTGSVIEEAFVDRGYRGHGEAQTTVYISGQKLGINTQRLKSSLKRREVIEPVIGQLRSDGLLGRNYLKGSNGDQMNVMLSCAGHNLRLILRQLRIFVCKYGATHGFYWPKPATTTLLQAEIPLSQGSPGNRRSTVSSLHK